MSMDSLYEYGSRAGFWRIHSEFQKRGLPLTVFGVAMALARHPEIVEAIKAADYDVVSHGWRWRIRRVSPCSLCSIMRKGRKTTFCTAMPDRAVPVGHYRRGQLPG